MVRTLAGAPCPLQRGQTYSAFFRTTDIAALDFSTVALEIGKWLGLVAALAILEWYSDAILTRRSRRFRKRDGGSLLGRNLKSCRLSPRFFLELGINERSLGDNPEFRQLARGKLARSHFKGGHQARMEQRKRRGRLKGK